VAIKIKSRELLRARKFNEYKSDAIKFIDDLVWLPAEGADMKCKLYDPQKVLIHKFLKYKFLVLLKSRQIGFSTICQIITAYLTVIYDNYKVGIISRSGSEASEFCRKTQTIINKLPKWIIPGYTTENAQSYVLKNGSALYSSAVSLSNPGGVLRGPSLALLIIDEAAWINKIDQAYTGVAGSLSKSQQVAKSLGIPYGTIILSTPGSSTLESVGYWFFKRWQSAVTRTSIWHPFKIHWSHIPCFRDDPEWYPQQCEILENDAKKIKTELDLTFLSGDGNVFPEDVNDSLQHIYEKLTPLKIIPINNKMEIWQFVEKIDPSKFYLVGVDTASQFGEDYSTVEVIDWETTEQVLEFAGKLPIKRFVDIVKHVLGMLPKHYAFIESNSYGLQVCEDLYEDEEGGFNIYGSWKKIKVNENTKTIFAPGISTNAKTRPLMLDSLYQHVSEFTDCIKSPRLALELVGLQEKQGRIEASVGSHDDLCLALSFVLYARKYLQGEISQSINISNKEHVEKEVNWFSNLNNDKSSIVQFEEKEKIIRKDIGRVINRLIDKGEFDILQDPEQLRQSLLSQRNIDPIFDNVSD